MDRSPITWKNEDPRPSRHGWAPGDYVTRCTKCDCKFIGAKRAMSCADCAYENFDEEEAFAKQLDADMIELEAAVNSIVRICHQYNAHWWVDPATGEDTRANPLILPTKQLLIVSEITEAMEADRKDLPDDKLPHLPGVVVETGDALIRIGDLAGAYAWALGRAVVEKFRFNLIRPDHKAENRVKKGGKKY